jgi:hypothetical protein
MKHTYFASHGTFSKVDHILGHKASLNKFKKIEITPCIISNHNEIKLDTHNKRNHRKYSNTWRLNNTLLKDQRVTKEKKGRNHKNPESNEHNLPELVGHRKSHAMGKVHSCKCLHFKKNREL